LLNWGVQKTLTTSRLRANGIERLVLELRPEPVKQTEEALA